MIIAKERARCPAHNSILEVKNDIMIDEKEKKIRLEYAAFYLSKTMDIIMDNYYRANELSYDTLFNAAIKGMMTVLDKYSCYYTTNELKADLITVKTEDPISTYCHDDTTWVVSIKYFNDQTVLRLKDAFSKMLNKKINKMIVDLRGNPGGLINPLVEICRLFSAKGIMFYCVDNLNKQVYNNTGHNAIEVNRLAVLVDQNTKSAAEILAMVLQDNGGIIFGKNTYGKGVAQKTFNIYGEGVLSLTTEEVFRPNGECINGIGIKPDIIVEDDEGCDEGDPVFKKALEVLLSNNNDYE